MDAEKAVAAFENAVEETLTLDTNVDTRVPCRCITLSVWCRSVPIPLVDKVN